MHAGQGGASNVRRIRARARGQVQGVSYRAATRAVALRLGLSGWVRNQADGSVLLEAQGSSERVAALVAWCKEGPPHAQVTALDVEDVAIAETEAPFEIKY